MTVDRRAFLAAASAAGALVPLGARANAQQTLRREADPGMVAPDKMSDPTAAAVNALARHAIGARFADLDTETVARAKLRIIDVIGCAIGGAVSEKQDALARLARATGGDPKASLIGFAGRAGAGEAAMVNAVSARAWDYEVMTIVAGEVQSESHHAPTTVMTALALAEAQHMSGRDFLTAMVVGDDVSARVLASTGVDFGKGWSPPPLFSAWGGTAIAGRLRGLDQEQMRSAFGMTVDQISGTGQAIWDGCTNWKLAQGIAARSAILSADLAKAGWSGMNDGLGAPFGFFAQFTGGCKRPEMLTARLGKAFYAEEYFKPYPQCAATHPALETALALRAANDLDPNAIDRIVISVQPRTLGLFMSKPFKPTPSAHAQANFSLAFAVASALRHGSFTLANYRPEAMADPVLTAMIARTRIVAMPAGRPGIRVEVQLRDGRSIGLDRATEASRYPRMGGSSRAQILDKFYGQVAFAGFMPADAAAAVVRRIDAIETVRDMAEFMAVVTRHTLPIPARA